MPNYTRSEPTHHHQALAGGAFTALVPTVLTVEPDPSENAEPLAYVVRLHVDVKDGRLVCTRLEIESTSGGPPVTSEELRRVPIGRYLREGAARTNLVGVPSVHGTKNTAILPVELPPPDYAADGMTDEVLHQTGKIFQWASAIGEAPLGVLKRDFGIPRAKASR